jgi:peptidoglycan/xylan/chitin deacetylase (PgdA/CDA1 family)
MINKKMLCLVCLLGLILSFTSYDIIGYFHLQRSQSIVAKGTDFTDRHSTNISQVGKNNICVKLPVTIPILMYHSIRVSHNRLCVSPADLSKELDYLKYHGYTTITMNQVWTDLHDRRSLPKKPVAITFDDGYRDNYTEAFPLLRERYMVATIFIITKKLNTPGGITVDELREMNKYGIEIGSHTQHHLNLRTLNQTELIAEIAQSRTILENIFHCPVVSFCYPSGKHSPAAVAEVKQAGYLGAVTVQPAKASSMDNIYLLPRVRVDGGESLKCFADSLL